MIRNAAAADLSGILDIHRQAFGSDAEADLVAQMLEDPTARPLVSLVAETDGRLAGHVLFTPVRIEGESASAEGAILAPLAVRPGDQGKGFGSALVRTGLERLKSQGTRIIFVYGDPDYYGRFGFIAARPLGLIAPNPLPPDYEKGWTVLAEDDALDGLSGTVRCCDVLSRAEYW